MSKFTFIRSLLIIGVPVTLACGVIAQSEVNLAPCGVVIQTGKNAQMIPARGKVVNRFSENDPIECGSMVLTHQESLWIKLSNQTVVKMAPHTFLELPASRGNTYRVYRGEILVSSPPSGSATLWITPNSETELKGGVVWLQYLAEDRRSTVGVFNRAVLFKNKFNSEAQQKVSTGEMSTLAIRDSRVTPSQPAVMSHSRLAELLKGFRMQASEQHELVTIVKQVYEDRAKALVSDIEEWNHEPEAEELNRGIASVPERKHAVNPEEESYTIKLLKKRLYGGEEEEPGRKPASEPAKPSRIQDQELIKKRMKIQSETRRIEKAIERMDPDLVD